MLALEQALEILEQVKPAEAWDAQDDLCDCVFQRIGRWTNPYIGETLEVRMCCIWADIYKQYPQYVRVTRSEPAIWNGEFDMPKAIWHRQLANDKGISVSEARALEMDAPKAIQRPEAIPFVLVMNGMEYTLDLAKVRRR